MKLRGVEIFSTSVTTTVRICNITTYYPIGATAFLLYVAPIEPFYPFPIAYKYVASLILNI